MGVPAYSSKVARYAVVGTVAPHHRGQMGALVRDRLMPVDPTPSRNRRQRSVTCRTTFLPARDLPQMWVKPRKVNEVGTADDHVAGRLAAVQRSYT
jgi:hypothetical protein